MIHDQHQSSICCIPHKHGPHTRSQELVTQNDEENSRRKQPCHTGDNGVDEDLRNRYKHINRLFSLIENNRYQPSWRWSNIPRKFQKKGRLHLWQVLDSVHSDVLKNKTSNNNLTVIRLFTIIVLNSLTSVRLAFIFHIHNIESSPPETSLRPVGEKQTAITLFLINHHVCLRNIVNIMTKK